MATSTSYLMTIAVVSSDFVIQIVKSIQRLVVFDSFTAAFRDIERVSQCKFKVNP